MKKKRTLVILALVAFAALGTTALTPRSSAQHALPLDLNAVFKTHVPHLNAPIGSGAPVAAKEVAPAASATFSGTPYAVGPTVTPTTTIPEAEEHIAVDPTNFNNLVAAISDFSLRGGFNTTKYVVSFENGSKKTWTENFVPLVNGFPATSDGQTWEANSDPVVAIDRLGNVFLADLYLNASNNANGLYVTRGTLTSPGLGFSVAETFPVATNLNPATTTAEDKDWIAVDETRLRTSGNVYVSWTRFIGGSHKILLSRSTDHAKTWSTPIRISPVSQDGAVQGSQVAVGPNGAVYVAYEVFFVGGLRQQFLAKSTDGGRTFTAPVAITPLFNELNFHSSYRKNSFASLAVSPTNGRVYAVYSDEPNTAVGAEVEFIHSTLAGGTSFTSPVVINDDSTGQQFMPALTVDSSGVIHTSWFDTRNSPLKADFYDIFAARSVDGGKTFSPNARVTSVIVDADHSGFIGDYAGVAAEGGFAHPVWTNGGFNNGLLQTATLH